MAYAKILQISDLHFTMKEQDKYRWDLFKQLNLILDNTAAVTDIIMAGDLTENKDNHSARLVNRVVSGFANLASKLTGKLYILPGNHDGFDPECPYFKFMSEIPNVVYLDKPQKITIGEREFWFLPHTRDVRDWDQIIPDFDGKIVIAHVTVNGVLAESGIKLESNVEASIFDKARLAFSGDIHKPQQVGNLEYIGCPYEVRFGDNFVGQGIILNTEDYSKQYVKFEFPRRIVLDVVSFEDLKIKVQQYVNKGYKKAQVKIRLHLDDTNMGQWREVKEGAKKLLDSVGYEYMYFEMPKAKTLTPLSTALDRQAKSLTTDYDAYCVQNKIGGDLKAAGGEIIAEAVFERLAPAKK